MCVFPWPAVSNTAVVIEVWILKSTVGSFADEYVRHLTNLAAVYESNVDQAIKSRNYGEVALAREDLALQRFPSIF